MSEQETAQETLEAEAVAEVEEVAQSVDDGAATPEQAAATLSKLIGIEVKPGDLDKFKNLDKWESKLRKQSMEKKVTDERQVESSDEGETPEFDDATRRALDAHLAKTVGPKIAAYEMNFSEQVEDTMTDFLKEHPDLQENTPEFVARVRELWTQPTVRSFKTALKGAYSEVSAVDPGEFEKKIRAKILKELAEQGEEVAEVKPKRSGVVKHRTPNDVLDDPNLTQREKAELLDAMDV